MEKLAVVVLHKISCSMDRTESHELHPKYSAPAKGEGRPGQHLHVELDGAHAQHTAPEACRMTSAWLAKPKTLCLRFGCIGAATQHHHHDVITENIHWYTTGKCCFDVCTPQNQ